ncbi:hypothetical protein ACKWTF_011207 [Chironomus riparius]
MSRWILFLQFAVTLAVGELNLSNYPCYKPQRLNYRNSRIVGGHNALKEQASYLAVLTRSGGNIFCGSSILNEKFIVTAAHCICNNKNKFIQPNQMKVYVGIHETSEIQKIQLNEIDAGMASEVIVDKIIVHPDYVCGKKSDSDIALLELKKSIKFSDYIKPVCVETKDINISTLGIVSGFGMTHEDFSIGEKPKTLQSANVPIWANDECQTSYESLGKTFTISNRQICAGGRNGASIDACYSDSGGYELFFILFLIMEIN